jgi:hypothetical protein
MKTLKKLFWCGVVILPAVSLWLLNSSLAGIPPALSIASTGSNTISLVVTNGTNNTIYEIYFAEFLDTNAYYFTNGGWTLVANGATGQTNFSATLGSTYTGFFRAVNGNDFDNDGIPNWDDARPFDPTVGILSVTIESPANGAVLH